MQRFIFRSNHFFTKNNQFLFRPTDVTTWIKKKNKKKNCHVFNKIDYSTLCLRLCLYVCVCVSVYHPRVNRAWSRPLLPTLSGFRKPLTVYKKIREFTHYTSYNNPGCHTDRVLGLLGLTFLLALSLCSSRYPPIFFITPFMYMYLHLYSSVSSLCSTVFTPNQGDELYEFIPSCSPFFFSIFFFLSID